MYVYIVVEINTQLCSTRRNFFYFYFTSVSENDRTGEMIDDVYYIEFSRDCPRRDLTKFKPLGFYIICVLNVFIRQKNVTRV